MINAEIYTIYSAPTLSISDAVQIYYLEAAFPYNAPENIVNAAGIAYNSYAANHAGLGIWDTTTGDKFSIEFLSIDYVGGLLPELTNGQITWKNTASIVITWPLVQDNWLSSRLVTTTIGSAYSQLITYMQDNQDSFEAYQPITGLYLNASNINNSAIYRNSEVSDMGDLILPSSSSYWFVDLLVTQLGTYGCDLDSFLQIYATSFNYLSDLKADPSIVSWSSPQQANSEVYAWYEQLNACYNATYQATVTNSQDASYFLDIIKSCYGPYAYVFRTNTSVYNVSILS
jgi:hypothetical protein